jgi:uncharacterized membrane protein
MRIKINNNPGIVVDKNFKIDFTDAAKISTQINAFLEKNNQIINTTAAGVYAVNLIGQIFEYIFANYLTNENPEIFTKTRE